MIQVAVPCTDIQFIYMDSRSYQKGVILLLAISNLVITVDWFSAYINRKAVQNALHTNIYRHC